MWKNRPPIVPNMPDVVLRTIFSNFDYARLCKMERVCKRWMNIIHSLLRRDVHEITIERLGSVYPKAVQCVPFRRLSIQCPADSADFLAGVFRRSRLAVMRMTTDIHFLANIQQVHVKKEDGRRYFSNVEDLWLLMVFPSDGVTAKFLEVEQNLFSELHHLTLQVHVDKRQYENVGEIVRRFVQRFPKAVINLELHANESSLILDQLSYFPSLPLNKIKVICTDFNLPQLRLDALYAVMRDKNIMAQNITIRDWSLFADGHSPMAYNPLDTFRISCCTVETVDGLVRCLQMTAAQKPPPSETKKKKVVVKKKKEDETTAAEQPKKKVVKRIVKRKKVPFIKKLEIAGQCTLHGLQFLQQKAHNELEKRLGTAIPDMHVDCSEIYYCW